MTTGQEKPSLSLTVKNPDYDALRSLVHLCEHLSIPPLSPVTAGFQEVTVSAWTDDVLFPEKP